MDPVQQLLVKIEVQEHIHRYAALVDTGDFDGLGDFFRHGRIRTRDEEGIERQWVGREEVRAVFVDTVRTWDGIPRTKHLVTNLSVTVDDDGSRAVCRSYYTVIHEPPDDIARIVIAGRYEDVFEPVDGTWWLTDRFVHSDLFGELTSHMKQTSQITTRLDDGDLAHARAGAVISSRGVAWAQRRLDDELTRSPLPPGSPLRRTSSDDILWSTNSVGEALQGVLSPLNWSFWEPVGELAMRSAYADAGIIPRREVRLPSRRNADQWSWAVFYGRVASNLTLLGDLAARTPWTSPAAYERNYFGIEEQGSDHGRSGARPLSRVGVPVGIVTLERRLRSRRRSASDWWTRCIAEVDGADADTCRGLLAEARVRLLDVNRVHILNALIAGILFDVVSRQVASVVDEDTAAQVLGGFGGTEEVASARELWDLAHGRGTLDGFLGRHGFHGPSEGEMSVPSWREDPAPIVQLIETYRQLDPDRSPGRGEDAVVRRGREARRRALAAAHGADRLRLRCAFAAAARVIPLRQVGKNAFVQIVDGARASARQLGDRLAAEGRLDDPSDVFLLTVDEALGRRSFSSPLIHERREERMRFLGLEIPETFQGVPVPEATGTTVARRREVRGLGASAGVAEGRVRVVISVTGDTELDDGDVLVCQTTDPSWVTLFTVAGAAVIDVGGPMSHGAIVAREMGIPCVIGTRDGTRVLRDGDRVRVDGAAGTVEVLDPA